MEMERINEDTIKVLIMPEDLEERGINFLELISNQDRKSTRLNSSHW